jgi:predicted PurR-regulated permease PerM
MNRELTYTQKVVIAVCVILTIAGLAYLIVTTFNFFLLIFGGILFAVMIRAAANWIHGKTNLNMGLSLTVALILIFGFVAATVRFVAPTVSNQIEELQETIPQAINNLQAQLSEYGWGENLINELQNADDLLPDQQTMVTQATGIFSTTLGIITDVLIVMVIGIFFAIDPKMYQKGLVRLFLPRKRPRLMEVLDHCYDVLKYWLFGKFIAMLFVGVVSGVALWLLGVPLALALGVITFFLDFIPTIGPIIAAIPAILMGLLQGPLVALYVAIAFFVIQSVESYLIIPIIYRKTVAISPVITLASLVFFGILAGPLGVILATPLVAVIQVLVKELYIKDYLERDTPAGTASGEVQTATAPARSNTATVITHRPAPQQR